ncbi:MAG: cystathionine beta-synthase [Bacteriovoracia bacterium]
MNKIYNNILEAIGNTPIVRLNKVTQSVESQIYAKCEFMNPGGSVKDRIGLAMIDDAEKKGLIKPGGTIVECTSGNTGVGLAIAAAIKGYKCVFVMPDKMSNEKIRGLRAFGAKVVITPTAVEPEDPRSYYSVARRIAAETPNALHLNQYDNLSNRSAHYAMTGPEIWGQTEGKFDAFVAGLGTCGTITGTAMFLKEKNPKISIVGVDPIGSLLYEYFKTGKKGPAHVYKIEGIGEDFVPKNLDVKVIDDIIQVNDKEAFQMTRKLAVTEGIFCGVSSGAAVCGALRWASQQKDPKKVIVLLPDSGSRYLSKVFDDDWMRENGFLEEIYGSVRDLVNSLQKSQNLVTATKNSTIEEVIQLMADKGISQIPVTDKKEVIGLVSEGNLLNLLFNGKIQKKDSVSSVAEKNFVIVKLDDDLEKAMQSLSNNIVPLVTDKSDLIGIITKIDVLNYLGKHR